MRTNNSRHEQMSETEKYIKSVLGLKDNTKPIYYLNDGYNFTEPRLYKDANNKRWCIRYSIKREGDSKYRYIKEYGGKYFRYNLNLISDLKEREAKFQELLQLVKSDLIKGVI